MRILFHRETCSWLRTVDDFVRLYKLTITELHHLAGGYFPMHERTFDPTLYSPSINLQTNYSTPTVAYLINLLTTVANYSCNT